MEVRPMVEHEGDRWIARLGPHSKLVVTDDEIERMRQKHGEEITRTLLDEAFALAISEVRAMARQDSGRFSSGDS